MRILSLAALLVAVPAFADEPAAAPPFTVKADPLFSVNQGGTRDLQLQFTVAPETKLYVDMIGIEVKDAAGLTVGELTKPAGKDFVDPWTDETRQIYDAATRVTVPITAPADVQGRVELTFDVYWQGCSPRMCYPPSGETLTVPVRVRKSKNG